MKAGRSAAAPPRGRCVNTGHGPTWQPIDIGHDRYCGLIEPDTAFWALIDKRELAATLAGGKLLAAYQKKAAAFAAEMRLLRFGLKPTTVYINATERCNLDCAYCYIPRRLRRQGGQMSAARLDAALARLKKYFAKIMPRGRLPQIVFHGAEPLLNRAATFAAIERYAADFRFGVQTNATLLDDAALAFLTAHGVGIGLSLDAANAAVADRTRKTWRGDGVFAAVVRALDRLRGYPGYNVIATVTTQNMRHLNRLVDFLHAREAPVCMLNIVRCTLPGARAIKPDDEPAAKYYLAALARTHELYRRTGRKLVVANFANILVSIIAPTARRLLCDISPCGGGRVFFALAPDGGMYPCSEFVGLKEFRGGNLFRDDIARVMASPAFRRVTGRSIENIEPCRRCAIRHFCGAPCPAEAQEMNGGMDRPGAFCAFYEAQVRYAFRLIADGRANDFLWDNWDKDTTLAFTCGD